MIKKALVVDDTEPTRRLISRMLLKFGLEAIEASDGQQALQALESQPAVDIAFVDWNMPVMTGIEFLRHVRQNASRETMKIVMVTGNTDMDSVQAALEAGVDEYIMLPLTKEVLQEKLALLGIYPTMKNS